MNGVFRRGLTEDAKTGLPDARAAGRVVRGAVRWDRKGRRPRQASKDAKHGWPLQPASAWLGLWRRGNVERGYDADKRGQLRPPLGLVECFAQGRVVGG